MKLLILKNGLMALGALALVVTTSSCGHTMYGMGLDMERVGRRLQTNHDPNAAGYGSAGSGAYQTQPGYGGYPAQPGQGGYGYGSY